MIKQLAFTRFIAAFAVVLYHYGPTLTLPVQNYVSTFIEKGYVFVGYFFVLSGFVMVVAYSKLEKVHFLSYIQNRFARIYPIYILALLAIVLIYFERKANFFDILWSVLMIQTWIPGKAMSLNFPGWSLSVEMFFYLLFPLCFNAIFKNFSLNFSIIFAFSFWLLSQLIYFFLWQNKFEFFLYNFEDFNYLPILHWNSFIIGNVCGLIYLNNNRTFKHNNLLLLILICFLYICLQYDLPFHNGLLAILFALIIYFLSKSKGIVIRILQNKFFIILGEISFGMYILQYPVFMTATSFRVAKYFNLSLEEDINLIFILKCLILILASIFSYYLIENPMRNKFRVKISTLQVSELKRN
jgi:peptidoglycan/LPS O-acetylase OafA/YrhL